MESADKMYVINMLITHCCKHINLNLAFHCRSPGKYEKFDTFIVKLYNIIL